MQDCNILNEMYKQALNKDAARPFKALEHAVSLDRALCLTVDF